MASSMPWFRNSATPAMFVRSSLPKIKCLAKRLYPWTKEGRIRFTVNRVYTVRILSRDCARSNLRNFPRNPLKKFKPTPSEQAHSRVPQGICNCLFLKRLFLRERALKEAYHLPSPTAPISSVLNRGTSRNWNPLNLIPVKDQESFFKCINP